MSHHAFPNPQLHQTCQPWKCLQNRGFFFMHLKYITQKTRRIYEGCLLPEHTPSLLNIPLFKTIGAYPDYWFFTYPPLKRRLRFKRFPISTRWQGWSWWSWRSKRWRSTCQCWGGAATPATPRSLTASLPLQNGWDWKTTFLSFWDVDVTKTPPKIKDQYPTKTYPDMHSRKVWVQMIFRNHVVLLFWIQFSSPFGGICWRFKRWKIGRIHVDVGDPPVKNHANPRCRVPRMWIVKKRFGNIRKHLVQQAVIWL